MSKNKLKKKDKPPVFRDVSSKMAEEANREIAKIAERILSRAANKDESDKEKHSSIPDDPE